MPVRVRAPFLVSLAALVLAPTARAQDVSARIIELIRAADLGQGAVVGVSIIDCRTGTSVAAYNEDEALQPASNMKLLTTGAALAILGPDYTFKTRVAVSGDDLLLIGSGDPALGDPEVLSHMEPPMTADDMLAAVAGGVQRAGVTSVHSIVVDDRIFDREMVHSGWPADQLDKHYAAGVSGLNFHANVLAFYPSPGPAGPGSLATCEVEPSAPWIPIQVDARTVGREGRHQYGVLRDPADNRFTVYGQIKAATQVAARVALHDNNLFFGRLLAFRLSRSGVVIGGARGSAQLLEHVRLADQADVFGVDRTLAVITTPLTDVIRRCNVDSVNLYAEALIKLIGHDLTGDPGSWTNGAAALRMTIADRLGPEAAASTIISDGSGFSRQNFVEPSVMTAWLRSISSDADFGDEFLASLPTIGEGTLESRFQTVPTSNRVLGKSGTINSVRCLSGFIIHEPSGRRLAYSVMVNGLREGTDGPRNAMRLHERIVAEADAWLTRRAEAAAANVGG